MQKCRKTVPTRLSPSLTCPSPCTCCYHIFFPHAFLDLFWSTSGKYLGFIPNSNISQVCRIAGERRTWLTQLWMTCLPLDQSAMTRSLRPCCIKWHGGAMTRPWGWQFPGRGTADRSEHAEWRSYVRGIWPGFIPLRNYYIQVAGKKTEILSLWLSLNWFWCKRG